MTGILTPHLNQYAESLDLRRYRVSLRNEVENEANKNFHEADEELSEASAAYWNRYYRARLAALDLDLPPNARVLDCACGMGRLGGALARAGEGGLENRPYVVSCDLSMNQLRQLRTLWPSGAPAAPTLGNLLSLPYPDASFDLVIGNSFLHHLPDVPAALREMQRVCKPGGYAVVLHEPNVYAPFWQAFPVSLYKNMSKTSDPTNFTDLWYFSAQDMRALLAEAGFRQAVVTAGGLLAAMMMNLPFILLGKLRIRWRALLVPMYRLRVRLERLEAMLTGGKGLPTAPSMLIVARK